MDLHRRLNITSTCWFWTGFTSSQGYGVTKRKIDGEWHTINAHRLMYMQEIGPIPEGHVIDHLCRVRNCLNPDHLESVTNHENVLRGNSGKYLRSRTHCPQGHKYTPENTVIGSKGTRECRSCKRARSHVARDRRKRLASPVPV